MPPFGMKICLDISPCNSLFLTVQFSSSYTLAKTIHFSEQNQIMSADKHANIFPHKLLFKYSKFLVFSRKMSRKGNFRELKSKTFSGISRGKHAPGPLQKACNFSTHYRIQSSFILLPRSLPPPLSTGEAVM